MPEVKRLLFVEDVPQFVHALHDDLEAVGARVQDHVVDLDGLERVLESAGPDSYYAAVVDIKLSDRHFATEGLEGVRLIREAIPSIPIAVITGFTRDYEWVRGALAPDPLIRVYEKSVFVSRLGSVIAGISAPRVPEYGESGDRPRMGPEVEGRSGLRRLLGSVWTPVVTVLTGLLVVYIAYRFGWNTPR